MTKTVPNSPSFACALEFFGSIEVDFIAPTLSGRPVGFPRARQGFGIFTEYISSTYMDLPAVPSTHIHVGKFQLPCMKRMMRPQWRRAKQPQHGSFGLTFLWWVLFHLQSQACHMWSAAFVLFPVLSHQTRSPPFGLRVFRAA